MSKYKYSDKTFVNPYHFIGLQDKCTREGKEYNERKGSLTGWIKCRLKTHTSIFIPNTSSVTEKNGEKHSDIFNRKIKKIKDNKEDIINSYDFFSYNNLSNPDLKEEELISAKEPVIPGSGIRGVIRSAFEAVTNSCLSTIDDEKLLFKRSTIPAREFARLSFNPSEKEWHLWECQRFRIPIKLIENLSLKEGQKVYVRIDFKRRSYKVLEISEKLGPGLREAFIHKGEYIEGKKCEAVFQFKRDKKTNHKMIKKIHQNETPKILNSLIENILLYREKANKTKNHNQYRHFDRSFGELKSIANLYVRFKSKKINYDSFMDILIKEYESDFKYLDGALVNVSVHDGIYYLSPAAIGREVFYHKLTDIIEDYKPCSEIERLCPTCALFGFTGNEGNSVASRVRFTDAFIENKLQNPADYYHNVRILKELASPKSSATEFYLKKNPDHAQLWNYDYALRWKGNIPQFLSDYQPQICGRKFYWHHKNPDPFVPKEKESDEDVVSKRNVVIRPLKAGNIFTFKVYFDEITIDELKRLLWVLTIGDKQNNSHKIGMGKPLGLGSVKITVSGLKLRQIIKQEGTIKYLIENKLEDYSDYTDFNHELIGCSDKVMQDFLTITSLNHSFKPIEYPTVENDPKNYLWFVANKQISSGDGLEAGQGKGGTGTSPIIEQVLPHLQKPILKKYKLKSNESKKNQ